MTTSEIHGLGRPPEVPARQTHRGLTTVALMLSMSMGAMDVTIVSTVMPTIVTHLGGFRLYSWVFTIYLLMSTVTVPIYGKLGDLIGRRPILMIGISLFLLGSIGCGASRTMFELILFRAMQGTGAGALGPMALTIVGDIFSVKERGQMMGVFGAVWATAGILGPLLGALIVRVLSWRWIFFLNVPIGLMSITFLFVGLHQRVPRKAHTLDLLGALLLSLTIVTLLLGTQGTAPLFLVSGSVALLALFVLVERRAVEPIVPLDLLGSRVYGVTSLVSLLMAGGMVVTMTFLPLYVQAILHGTPAAAGMAIGPAVITWPIAAVVSTRIVSKVGFRIQIQAGALVATMASFALPVFLHPGMSLRTIQLITAVSGVGLGFANTMLLLAVQTSVGWNRRGVVTAGTLLARAIGGTIAVGVSGAVLGYALRAGGATTEVVSTLIERRGRALDPALLERGASLLEKGLAHVWWILSGLTAAAALASLMFPDIPLRPLLPADVAEGNAKEA